MEQKAIVIQLVLQVVFLSVSANQNGVVQVVKCHAKHFVVIMVNVIMMIEVYQLVHVKEVLLVKNANMNVLISVLAMVHVR